MFKLTVFLLVHWFKFFEVIYKMIGLVADIVGLFGVSLVLGCYFLLQTGRMSQSSFQFSLFNLIGAILVLMSLWVHWNLASVVIEVFWMFISVYGLINAHEQKA
tara:strand:+ start:910 stop:1221 length:312 start_codon:yes stop_codon:yes gene_type:complete